MEVDKNVILSYHGKEEAETAKRLAKLLDFGFTTCVPKSADVLIRFGCSGWVPFTPRVELNTRQAITNAADKLLGLQILQKANIPTLHFSEKPPCIGRSREHSGGSGLWLCLSKADIRNASLEGAAYFVAFIPSIAEFRVHVVRGKGIVMQQRCPPVSFASPLDRWIRSPWELNRVNFTQAHPAVKLAVRAVEELGLDFGAADVIQGEDEEYLILEVNTAPGLDKDGPTEQAYVEAFQGILK